MWTAVVRSGTRPVATAAGNSAEDAIANAIERAQQKWNRDRQGADHGVSEQTSR